MVIVTVIDDDDENDDERERERNVVFNDALHHSDSERGNLLPPHRLLFTINSKGSFICTIPQTG